jgi:hypothetical protein
VNPTFCLLVILLGIGCLALRAQESETVSSVQAPQVLGVIVDHIPASSGLYIGSPSIAILTNGDYLVSHDYFGPQSAEFELARSAIFHSTDRGATWKKTAEIQGAFWSTLFVHHGAVYLLGTDRHHGNVVIRRSFDGGKSSANLHDWENRGIVLHHQDSVRHAFQYVDWLFDGQDLIAACRTAYDDAEGGAHSGHDANFLTFHRIVNFRSRSTGQEKVGN